VFRFAESTARFRERIAAGDIGRPIFARAEFSYSGAGHARTWLYNRSIAGGGPIADVGVHCIDALRYLLQDEPRLVSALGRPDERCLGERWLGERGLEQSSEVEAAAILTLAFQRGTPHGPGFNSCSLSHAVGDCR